MVPGRAGSPSFHSESQKTASPHPFCMELSHPRFLIQMVFALTCLKFAPVSESCFSWEQDLNPPSGDSYLANAFCA